MSLSTVEHILLRIRAATFESPIAVFRTTQFHTIKLDAIFAATVKGAERVKRESHNLIGVYNLNSDLPDMNNLREYLNKELKVPAK